MVFAKLSHLNFDVLAKLREVVAPVLIDERDRLVLHQEGAVHNLRNSNFV